MELSGQRGCFNWLQVLNDYLRKGRNAIGNPRLLKYTDMNGDYYSKRSPCVHGFETVASISLEKDPFPFPNDPFPLHESVCKTSLDLLECL